MAAIAATLALSHVTFAAAASRPQASPANKPTVLAQAEEMDRQLTRSMRLADNCYVESQVERAPDGKAVTRLVQECD